MLNLKSLHAGRKGIETIFATSPLNAKHPRVFAGLEVFVYPRPPQLLLFRQGHWQHDDAAAPLLPEGGRRGREWRRPRPGWQFNRLGPDFQATFGASFWAIFCPIELGTELQK